MSIAARDEADPMKSRGFPRHRGSRRGAGDEGPMQSNRNDRCYLRGTAQLWHSIVGRNMCLNKELAMHKGIAFNCHLCYFEGNKTKSFAIVF